MLAAPATSRLRSNLSLLLLPALLVGPLAARAADLGPILLTSPAGQPLQGLVSLSLGTDESPDDLGVAVGTAAEYGWLEIGRPAWADDVEVHVTNEDGEPRVRIWTAEAPPDRQFSLLLVVSSPTGRSLRQYDVVLRDAEVLLAPAEPQPGTGAEVEVKRPGGKGSGEAVAATPESSSAGRAPRRAMQTPERGEPQVRRNLSISSATARLSDSALEKRAQRLEETSAAQQRALSEANARITDLQGQIEKLEKLLALKGVAPVAVPPPAASADAQKAMPNSPAKAADTAKPTDANAKPAAGGEKPAEALPASKPAAEGTTSAAPANAPAPEAPPSAAAPMVEVDPAAEAQAETKPADPAAESAEKPAGEADKAEQPAEDGEHDDGLTGLLMTVGGVVLALLLATLGAFWWRRRRAQRAELAAAMAAAAAVAPEDAPAEPVVAPMEEAAPVEPSADAETPAPDASAPSPAAEDAAAIGAVDESIAAALDAPLGDVEPVEATAPADTPVATLAAVTAEPSEPAAADDLDAMFSEEAIAAAQAAIQGAATAEGEPVALPETVEPAAEPSPQPAAAALPTADEAEDEADDPADLEDVEVNLAKAYIDMGDPDGARAILESMMSDPDDPDRAALARRTMRRFGLRPSAPPAEGAAAEG